ncbi:MAG: HEAT repeat domain-containing protein [Leptolyngbyaceae cyanobacterium MAG.088]|nr:HEAT repeat domain-containing protein [Leptolyngbyaceae cyanobacterium MAG.088]
MMWRFPILFLTTLTAVVVPAASLQAKTIPVLMAQASLVDPDAAIDTGQTTPDFSGSAPNSSLQRSASAQQAEEIKSLQQELKTRGFYNGPIDGIYGPATDRAIRTIRGQEGIAPALSPSDFPSVTTAPADAVVDTQQPASNPPEPSQSDSGAEADPVRVNTENAADAEDTEDVNIGDSVSPETGVDTSESEPVQSSSAEAPQSSSDSSPGLGRLLWPGLALITALGSFGIGFLFANRVKPNADEADSDSAWGTIPDAVQQSDDYPAVSQTPQNGYAVANGHHSANATGIAPLSSQSSDGLANNAGMVSPTTRLAKVDVIDELVANLQVADPSKRRKAIWELGQRGNSSAVQHLVNGMVDADSKEKSLILAALSEIGIRSLKPMNRALAIALQDENADVRKNAIRDLTRVYDLVTQISQMLGHATEDEDPEVRRTAEWALEQLNRIREAPKLQSSIHALESARSTSELLPDEVENLKN